MRCVFGRSASRLALPSRTAERWKSRHIAERCEEGEADEMNGESLETARYAAETAALPGRSSCGYRRSRILTRSCGFPLGTARRARANFRYPPTSHLPPHQM